MSNISSGDRVELLQIADWLDPSKNPAPKDISWLDIANQLRRIAREQLEPYEIPQKLDPRSTSEIVARLQERVAKDDTLIQRARIRALELAEGLE